jgi:hypothetical protein
MARPADRFGKAGPKQHRTSEKTDRRDRLLLVAAAKALDLSQGRSISPDYPGKIEIGPDAEQWMIRFPADDFGRTPLIPAKAGIQNRGAASGIVAFAGTSGTDHPDSV